MPAQVNTDQIDGTPRTVKELFSGRKYGLKYYQREYAWTEANLSELLDDLSMRFLNEYQSEHERGRVADYRPYFLGPIVTTNEGGVLYLVDGQQRLTTLSLLLLHLLQTNKELESELRPLVYSTKYGKHSFNLQVPEREAVMQAILAGKSFDPTATTDESVRTLWARYQDVARLFPQELQEEAILPFFVDWLLERVVIVEIAASDGAMALEIFETMNDRGARLTASDMLKSYLLGNLPEDEIEAANLAWRQRVTELADTEKTADADFLKAWLRAKYATSIRERAAGSAPKDWENIGSAYHKWVRDHRAEIGLSSPAAFSTFVNRDFKVMSGRYLQLLQATHTFRPNYEHVYYLGATGFTLHPTVILSATTPGDDDATFQQKARLVSGYIDRLVAQRMVNYRNFGYSQMYYTMFSFAKEVRDLPLDDLTALIAEHSQDDSATFESALNLRLNQRNRPQIHYLLARISAWVDQQCGTGPGFPAYMNRMGGAKSVLKAYEIEHIWADHLERHPEYSHAYEFGEVRNRFGGLLLLPKDFNASYGDMPYDEKVTHYTSQNLLARSLHPSCYAHNPSFVRLVAQHALPFKPYPENFSEADMLERQELYRQLCELVWAPESYGAATPVASE